MITLAFSRLRKVAYLLVKECQLSASLPAIVSFSLYLLAKFFLFGPAVNDRIYLSGGASMILIMQ